MLEEFILVCIFAFIVMIWNKVDNIETILNDIKQYIHNNNYDKLKYK